MNTQRDISKRLLRLFPVKVLKEHFNSTNVSDELYNEILNGNSKPIIDSFCYVNLEHTKQHIYIYNIGQAPTPNNLNINQFPIDIVHQTNLNGVTSITISPIVDFKVILTNPFEETTLRFHQPIQILLSNTHLIFYATILEKNMSNYFDQNRRVINAEKINDEISIIEQVCAYLAHLNPTVCDLNRGIKQLWANDLVDSKYAKWKKDRSTTTETMDENYTLKSQYPDVYQNLVNAPLRKMIFKYLRDDEALPDHFTVDPSSGQISIPLFSKNANQNKNVVREILSNN